MADIAPERSTEGGLVERYLYDPYGRVTFLKPDWSPQEVTGHDDGAASAFGNEILFTDYRYNPTPGSGTFQARNREYHPTLGRFMQRDPLGYVDGGNLYEYVRSGPTRQIDPNGTETLGIAKFNDIAVRRYVAYRERTIRRNKELGNVTFKVDVESRRIEGGACRPVVTLRNELSGNVIDKSRVEPIINAPECVEVIYEAEITYQVSTPEAIGSGFLVGGGVGFRFSAKVALPLNAKPGLGQVGYGLVVGGGTVVGGGVGALTGALVRHKRTATVMDSVSVCCRCDYSDETKEWTHRLSFKTLRSNPGRNSPIFWARDGEQ